jgi:hypothetical protein
MMVARLDVAMHDALRVRFRQALADLRRDVERFLDRQRPRLESFLQRLPVVVRHHDEQLPIVGGLDVVNGADVRVIGRRGGLRLTDEALLRAFVVTPLRRQEFQRDDAAETRGASGVDDTHSTAANAGERI